MFDKLIKRYILIIFVMTLFISIIQLCIPYELSAFVDNINNFDKAKNVIFIFLILIILLFVMTNLVKIVEEKIAYKLIDKIRNRILEKVLKADDAFFTNKSENAILEIFEVDLNKIYKFLSNTMPTLFVNISTIVLIIIYLSIKVKLIILFFILYIMIDVILLKICNRNQNIVLKEANFHSEIDSKIGEWLNINNIIYHSNTSSNFINKFIFMQNELRKLKVRVNKYYYSIWCVSLLLGVLIDLSVLFFGGILFFKHIISIGNLYLFYSYAKRLQEPLETFQQQLQYVSEFKFSCRRVNDLLLEIDTHNIAFKDENKFYIDAVKSIKLINTCFSYNESKPILKNVNLKLKSGDVIGVIGSSGQGKSTLCKLMVKRVVDKKSNVYINNINIADINIDSLYKTNIYLDNDPIIFKGSVIENLMLFDNDNINKGISLFEKYNLFDIIGINYNEIVNPENIDLKTAQLINVSRLLFVNKSLIILDEAFSEIETDLSAKIIRMIKDNFDNSIIIHITHQHDKLSYCEHIYELKDGVLYESK